MKPYIAVLLLFFSTTVKAQSLNAVMLRNFQRSEDSMKQYSRAMITDPNSSQRFIADSIFIRMLVKSLRNPHSFYYPYDSIETVSRIYAPDSSFRIFSWQFNRDDSYFRQRGAIQMRTTDGLLKLFPLLDMSEFTEAPQDSVRTATNWVGAIYYGMVMKTFNDKKYYTLLGFDDNNAKSTRKWIEVLTFNGAGQPRFGGPYFALQSAKQPMANQNARFCLEYKKEGKARLNYDAEMDMIVYDHLVSEDNTPDKKYTLVPDGDYEGFKWDNGRWNHIDKVFDFKLKDGEAPMPEPLKDDAGNSNEEKLRQQSEKNRQKNNPVKPAPAKPVTKPLSRQPKDEAEP
ncbi:MAG: hypothetical protein LH478_07765 [Chitinophagaceae bacterium]|nr:hypothetical protein [Chitinophagaceae bacterium]